MQCSLTVNLCALWTHAAFDVCSFRSFLLLSYVVYFVVVVVHMYNSVVTAHFVTTYVRFVSQDYSQVGVFFKYIVTFAAQHLMHKKALYFSFLNTCL